MYSHVCVFDQVVDSIVYMLNNACVCISAKLYSFCFERDMIVAFFAGFSLGLYERIKGRDLDMKKCVVEWNHSDLAEVGGPSVVSISVSVQLYALWIILCCCLLQIGNFYY